jgi:hypothetical protein
MVVQKLISRYWSILDVRNDGNFALEDLGTACLVLK